MIMETYKFSCFTFLIVDWHSLLVQKMTKKHRGKFFNFVSPIVVVFQFFGIAPRIKSSKYKDLMHMACQYLRIVLMTTTMYYNPNIIGQTYEITSQVTLQFLLFSYAVTVGEAILTRKRQLKIIDQLCRIDEIICTKFCTDFDNYSAMKKRYTRFIWSVFLGMIALKIFHWFTYNKAPAVGFLTWTYAHFGIGMRLLQNTFYVDMVYERLCILHKELNKLTQNCCKVQQQLNLASNIYRKLWLMTYDINFSFGWSLLAIVVECIIDLVNEVNVMYLSCCSYQSINTAMGAFSFTTVTIWPLILLAQSCERCVMTAKKTSVIVHSISHFKHLQNYATDIRLLSLQIYHERFYISANGFCDIGLKTIGSIIKTCTLYSIIIIQFDVNE